MVNHIASYPFIWQLWATLRMSFIGVHGSCQPPFSSRCIVINTLWEISGHAPKPQQVHTVSRASVEQSLFAMTYKATPAMAMSGNGRVLTGIWNIFGPTLLICGGSERSKIKSGSEFPVVRFCDSLAGRPTSLL